MIKAFIFDMGDILINSEKVSFATYRRILTKDLPEHYSEKTMDPLKVKAYFDHNIYLSIPIP